jgi:hypothetical protein
MNATLFLSGDNIAVSGIASSSDILTAGWDLRHIDAKVHMSIFFKVGRMTIYSTCKVSTQRLWCDDKQCEAIEEIYEKKKALCQTFTKAATSQAMANTLLLRNGLQLQSLEQLESRWMKVWSSKWWSRGDRSIRILLQWYLYFMYLPRLL